MSSPYRGVVPILGLVVEYIEPGVFVEAGVVVRSLDGGAHVEAVTHRLQGRVPEHRRDNVTCLTRQCLGLSFKVGSF